MRRTYSFEALPLPYAYDSLEPYISTDTLYFHHDKHYHTYVENLNKELAKHSELQDKTLEELLKMKLEVPDDYELVRRNAGGVYNHEMYFESMIPGGSSPNEAFCQELIRTFGSEESFKKAMSDMAVSVFGSGYAWLAATDDGKILIVSYKNQDNPIMYNLIPLLPVDVWEHAYYLDYQHRRSDYVDKWFERVNWEIVSGRYLKNKN